MASITRDSDRVLFLAWDLHWGPIHIVGEICERDFHSEMVKCCQSSLINGYGIPKIRLSFKFLRRRTDGALILLIENI